MWVAVDELFTAFEGGCARKNLRTSSVKLTIILVSISVIKIITNKLSVNSGHYDYNDDV